MAKKSFKLQNKKLFLLVSVVLLVAIGVGLYFVYKQNLGATDSDAGIEPKLLLLSSSVSKTDVKKGENFTVKCNYQIPYTMETKQFDGITAARKTAEGIYVIGDNISCTRGPVNFSEPGNVTFTCKSNTDGIYSVGCGIKPDTTTYKLVKETKQNCTPVYGYVKKFVTIPSEGTSCPSLYRTVPKIVMGSCKYTNNSYTFAYMDYGQTGSKCKSYVTITPVVQALDELSSYKIIDNVKVGNPTGTANCVVPALLSRTVSSSKLYPSRSIDNYETSCVYALKDRFTTSSVVVTADKASCATTTNRSTVGGVTISNPDVMYSKCTIPADTAVGTKVTTKCSFVAGTVNDVDICGRTDTVVQRVEVAK